METELLAYVASRVMQDGRSVFVDTGLPMIAAMLAQRTYAPGLLLIFEASGVGLQMLVLPISVGDSRTLHRAIVASTMRDVVSALQSGYVDYGFLCAAEIDAYGNINTARKLAVLCLLHPAAALRGSTLWRPTRPMDE